MQENPPPHAPIHAPRQLTPSNTNELNKVARQRPRSPALTSVYTKGFAASSMQAQLRGPWHAKSGKSFWGQKNDVTSSSLARGQSACGRPATHTPQGTNGPIATKSTIVPCRKCCETGLWPSRAFLTTRRGGLKLKSKRQPWARSSFYLTKMARLQGFTV